MPPAEVGSAEFADLVLQTKTQLTKGASPAGEAAFGSNQVQEPRIIDSNAGAITVEDFH